eukprot:SAG31_NODE_2863_length_4982_cov_2.545361_2_plen_56_part_00
MMVTSGVNQAAYVLLCTGAAQRRPIACLVDRERRAHRGLDDQRVDVLPALLQQPN